MTRTCTAVKAPAEGRLRRGPAPHFQQTIPQPLLLPSSPQQEGSTPPAAVWRPETTLALPQPRLWSRSGPRSQRSWASRRWRPAAAASMCSLLWSVRGQTLSARGAVTEQEQTFKTLRTTLLSTCAPQRSRGASSGCPVASTKK